MKIDSPPVVAGSKQLKKLRNSLAIIHCRKLLTVLQKEAEGTVSHDQSKRVTYLMDLYSRIHREIFQDWKDQATITHRPGTMLSAENRQAFRETIERLVLHDEDNHETAVFDNNGFVMATPNIANRLATFYQTMRGIRPFGYGNKLTLDLFMTALGNLPAFKAVYEHGIDFRRLDAFDAVALHDYTSSFDDVQVAFEHALDPTRTRSLENIPNGYGQWPEHKKFVFGLPFLGHTTEDGTECLVTVTGGLVPVDGIREEVIVRGSHVADYPLSLSENVIGYLPGTEALRAPGKGDVDGILLGDDGLAPLFCLDVNILTGLRFPSHTELMELIKQCEGEKTSVLALADNAAMRDRLIEAADDDVRLRRAVEIAYDRLSRIKSRLDQAKEAIFEGKSATNAPRLFLCMGGAGVGKTAVEEIARAECGENFVIASLDEFRKQSDLYAVLTAANHHSDDYVFVEPFANTLRDMVANQAREMRISLLYDGTSIPYVPRYSNIVEGFKNAGFKTLIAAVDSFIVKPRGREEELPRSHAIFSVKYRFEKTGRALPWVVAVDKHIRAPGSFLNALEHQSLDKLSLFANDGERDKHYLVAESFSLTDEDLLAMQESQVAGNLLEYMKDSIRNGPCSTLENLSQGDPDALQALIDRNPIFEEANVAYLVYASHGGNRVLLIYNTRRMVDFLEKGQLNPNASGEDGLLHKHATLAFHVDPRTAKPWLIRLQDSASTARL
jgi:uncharacterized membrane protein